MHADRLPSADLAVLCVAGRPAEADALAAAVGSAAGPAARARSAACPGSAAGLLSSHRFDALIVRHDPPRLDALSFAAAATAGGRRPAAVILGDGPPASLDARCLAAGAAYRRLHDATPASLMAVVADRVRLRRIEDEHRRLVAIERERLQRDHREAELLLGEQRRLVAQLEAMGDAPAGRGLAPWASLAGGPHAPAERFGRDYGEALRAFVIEGGPIAGAVGAIAARLVDAGVGGRQAADLHVSTLEELLSGLGARGARHVVGRADLVLTELLAHLADAYRQRYDQTAAADHAPPHPRPPTAA